MLTVTVLGCDGSHQGMGGACSSYMVKEWGTGTTVLLDMGSGSFSNYQRFFNLDELDAVILSHSHPDHWADIDSLAVAMRYTIGRTRPLRIIAPEGVMRLTQHVHGPLFEWDEVASGSSITIQNMHLSFYATDHVLTTLAIRIDAHDVSGDVVTLGYTADTGTGWQPKELGDGLDMLISEATFTSAYEGKSQHLSGRQAGQFAREAGAQTLMVTHHWSNIDKVAILDEATEAFGDEVIQAHVGLGVLVRS